MSIEQITDDAGLASLLADARGEGRCALDTEFVWERTYAPVLCLVQIATAERLAVVDPLRGAPLQPVADLVADGSVVKAMHAPGADLTGLALHFGTGAAAVFERHGELNAYRREAANIVGFWVRTQRLDAVGT